jgi:hypothetical protein
LAVGNNGESLVADSAATTGLRYSATPSASNPIINSAMQVWQRGTSITMSTSAYTADRWQGYRGVAGGTVSRQVTGDTTNLPFIQYCARVQRDVGNTDVSSKLYLAQTLESVNTIPFVGKTITFSFYARKGANYSQASSQIPFAVYGAATTDANVLTSMSGTLITNVTATLTTTWQRFTGTAAVSASYTQIGMYAEFTPVGTAGAADYFEVTGVQIDIGSVALPFRTYAATIQGELSACQRYYEKSFTQATTPANGNSYNYGLVGSAYATGTAFTQWNAFQVIKRNTSSTITFYRNSDIATNGQWAYFSSGWATPTTTTSNTTNDRGFQVALNKTAGFTLNAGLIIAGEWTAEAEL